ncbi:hypothetical protein [Oligoflexus tunisiensis]|nr:hypothetical protein [Oligoflexus tunisiensis]
MLDDGQVINSATDIATPTEALLIKHKACGKAWKFMCKESG